MHAYKCIHTVLLEVWKLLMRFFWISCLHKHNPWVVILSNILYLHSRQQRLPLLTLLVSVTVCHKNPETCLEVISFSTNQCLIHKVKVLMSYCIVCLLPRWPIKMDVKCLKINHFMYIVIMSDSLALLTLMSQICNPYHTHFNIKQKLFLLQNEM